MVKIKVSLPAVLKRAAIYIRRDLGFQIALFYLLFVVPVVVVAFIFGRAINLRLQDEVMAADLALARTLAQQTELNLTNARYAALDLARQADPGTEPETVEPLYSILFDPRTGDNPLDLIGDWGVIWNRTPVGLDVVPPNAFPSRDYLQQSDINRPSISGGWISSSRSTPVVTALIPLWDDLGNVLGVVVSNIELRALSTSLETLLDEYQINEAKKYEAVIIDGSRKIIADPSKNQLLVRASMYPADMIQEVIAGHTGNYVGELVGEDEMLFSYAPIPGTRWGVIVHRPTASAFGMARVFTRWMLIVVGIFVVVGIAFWTGLSLRVIRPLENLAKFSQSISQNEKLSIPEQNQLVSLAGRPDQVGHLTDTLVNMEAAIEARLNELATLLQTSAAVVATLDREVVLDRILEQVARLLDVEMSAIVALDRHDGVFRAQASRGISPKHVALITIDPADTESITLNALRNQETIQVSDTNAPHPYVNLTERAKTVGYSSILAIPLQTLFAPPSALLIYRVEPHVFSSQEISLLESFANHAAMAIENAALFERSDMRLQEQTRRLEALIQSLKDGLILENLDGKITYANRRISELTRIPGEELVGAPVDEVIDALLAGTKDAALLKDDFQFTPDMPDPAIVEFEIPRKGRMLNLRLQMFSVTDSYGVVIGRGRFFYDVTADHEIGQMKSRLVSTVSHELRTPLASIKGYATTLLAEDVDWDQHSQREFLHIISSETDRLSAMVTDLLDLSKIEAGSMMINLSNSNLGEVIKLASERAYPFPDDRLKIEIQEDLPVLEIDKRLIEAVLRNLIENAAKYAGDDSPIYIHAVLEDHDVVIYVRDEGPGIPVQYQGQIFESFYQPDMGTKRTQSGFGLGLTICKGFVEAHGGKIWLEPCSSGACFAFSLPVDEDVN